MEKAAEGQEIKKFLNFAIPDADDRKMLLEYAGYSLTADASQQRFLMICGIGGTGKSVLIRLLESMVGQENVSNVSMQELNKRYSTSLLLGKILNSCADLSMEALEERHSCVSGYQREAEQPYHRLLYKEPYCL